MGIRIEENEFEMKINNNKCIKLIINWEKIRKMIKIYEN